MLGLEATTKKKSNNQYEFKIIYKRRAGGQGHGDTTRAIAIAAAEAVKIKFIDIDDLIRGMIGTGHRSGDNNNSERGVLVNEDDICSERQELPNMYDI